MPQVPFAAGSYKSLNSALDAQRTVNFYSEAAPSKNAESEVGVFGCPGLSQWVALKDNGATDYGPVRGWRVVQGVLYVVSSANFYSVSTDGVVTALNTSAIDGNGVISISDNGLQVVFVTGFTGWCYTIASSTFAQITDAGFYPSKTITYVDGYFLLERTGTNQFFYSALLDGTSYPGQNYASKEAAGDRLQAVNSVHQQLALFGEKTIELWQDTETIPVRGS